MTYYSPSAFSVGQHRYTARQKTPHMNAAPPYHGDGAAGRQNQLEPSAAMNSNTKQRTAMNGIGQDTPLSLSCKSAN